MTSANKTSITLRTGEVRRNSSRHPICWAHLNWSGGGVAWRASAANGGERRAHPDRMFGAPAKTTPTHLPSHVVPIPNHVSCGTQIKVTMLSQQEFLTKII